jgi:carbonic anhydrase
MDRVIEQARTFHDRIADQRAEFSHFAHGQHPEVLFITCSDSRIVPALITNTRPGDMFELRNAGNIVRPYDVWIPSAEGGTIEYAVQVLEVTDIVLCGHSHCGAVGALARQDDLDRLPAVGAWLRGCGSLSAVSAAADASDPSLAFAAQQHLLTQIEHLHTYPAVRHRVDNGQLHVHTWFYEVHTGAVLAFRHGFFTPL